MPSVTHTASANDPPQDRPCHQPGPDQPSDSADAALAAAERDTARVSVQVERWLGEAHEKTLGSLIEFFGKKSFALIFVLLLGVPACAPTEGTGGLATGRPG